MIHLPPCSQIADARGYSCFSDVFGTANDKIFNIMFKTFPFSCKLY